jgi:hypothetical protein
MSISAKERKVLRRYLLGELPELERSQLADRYFVDEELFDELLDVENELLGHYVRKQLSPAESKRFSQYLGQLPDGASKLATAYALMEAANELREVPASSADAVRLPFDEVVYAATSRWHVLRQWLFADHHVLRYATVVVLIALIAGLSYLSVTKWRLRRDSERLRAERSQSDQNQARLPPETAPQQDRTAKPERSTQPEENLAQSRQQEQRSVRPSANKRRESGNVALSSLILTPALRSGGTPDSLVLSPETKTISLIIPIPQEERIASYRAVLQTTSGRVILSDVRLRPRPSNGAAVSLRLPASQMTNETHKLTLLGKAADGIDVAHDYYFKVVRTQ